ncbi:MAG TPA: protein phosphatase CheZ [Pseudolabrys sp.]|nr:protein phosphatase CheZ [Pseudolabrys sp.]
MQQKQFRIEQLLAGGRCLAARTPEDAASLRRSLAALVVDANGRRLTRAAAELGAAIETIEKAAQIVLSGAESIDDGARALAATETTDHGRRLARDLQARVQHIYEACNFQDLAGQRIGKVIGLLADLDEQLTRVVSDGDVVIGPATAVKRDELINGPRLDGASGHVSQTDVDLLFG